MSILANLILNRFPSLWAVTGCTASFSPSAPTLNHRTGLGRKLLSSLVARARTQSPDWSFPFCNVNTAASGPVVACTRSSASGPTFVGRAIGVPLTSMMKESLRVFIVPVKVSPRNESSRRMRISNSQYEAARALVYHYCQAFAVQLASWELGCE
jgi:hypothetical protein